MKLGFFIDNKGNGSVDLSSIEYGNPGIGGSEYEAILAAFLLAKRYSHNVLFYSRDTMNFGTASDTLSINVRKVDSLLDALDYAKQDGIELFFLNKHANTPYCSLNETIKKITLLKLNCVTIGQCFYSLKELNFISKCKYIRRNLYVSAQLKNCYLWHGITKKSKVMFNMVPASTKQRSEGFDDKKYVTYVGSLVGPKSFHTLAQQWKKIVAAVPDAELHVIGSGKLYSRDSKLGKYGIADESYENWFMYYLCDDSGNMLPSVHFHGVLNADQMKPIFDKTAAGVVNPTGLTETFCISGVEMQSFGIPVVSKKYGGLIDTISDGVSGTLVKNEEDLAQAIISLLTSPEQNQQLGKNAIDFANSRFTPDVIMPLWQKVICEIEQDTKYSSLAKTKGFASFIREKRQNERPSLYYEESIFMPSNNYKWVKPFNKVVVFVYKAFRKIFRIIKKCIKR